jgi:hypothetical protein
MFVIFRNQDSTSELKQTWQNAGKPLQNAILHALQELDRQLAEDPHRQGESRDWTTRILFHAPVAVLYSVDVVGKVVHILRTWAYTVKTAHPE